MGSSSLTAEDVIRLLDLRPLPMEGGYYRETYRSAEVMAADALPERYAMEKAFSTAIYYLLTPETCSLLHRLPGDEIYHFYMGGPVTMLQLHPDGSSEVITLGPDIAAGEHVQAVVPAGAWQGSFLKDGGAFALLGATMAPGFDFSDFTLGDCAALAAAHPDRAALIARLTPPAGPDIG